MNLPPQTVSYQQPQQPYVVAYSVQQQQHQQPQQHHGGALPQVAQQEQYRSMPIVQAQHVPSGYPAYALPGNALDAPRMVPQQHQQQKFNYPKSNASSQQANFYNNQYNTMQQQQPVSAQQPQPQAYAAPQPAPQPGQVYPQHQSIGPVMAATASASPLSPREHSYPNRMQYPGMSSQTGAYQNQHYYHHQGQQQQQQPQQGYQQQPQAYQNVHYQSQAQIQPQQQVYAVPISSYQQQQQQQQQHIQVQPQMQVQHFQQQQNPQSQQQHFHTQQQPQAQPQYPSPPQLRPTATTVMAQAVHVVASPPAGYGQVQRPGIQVRPRMIEPGAIQRRLPAPPQIYAQQQPQQAAMLRPVTVYPPQDAQSQMQPQQHPQHRLASPQGVILRQQSPVVSAVTTMTAVAAPMPLSVPAQTTTVSQQVFQAQQAGSSLHPRTSTVSGGYPQKSQAIHKAATGPSYGHPTPASSEQGAGLISPTSTSHLTAKMAPKKAAETLVAPGPSSRATAATISSSELVSQGKSLGTGPQKAFIDKVIVPWGWKRLLLSDSVIYYSPSGIQLRNLTEVKSYLLQDGTCKCGLECPMEVNKVFDFDNRKQSKVVPFQVSSKVSRYCNHKKSLHSQSAYEKIKHEHLVGSKACQDEKESGHFRRFKGKRKKKPFSGLHVAQMLEAREAERARIQEVIQQQKRQQHEDGTRPTLEITEVVPAAAVVAEAAAAVPPPRTPSPPTLQPERELPTSEESQQPPRLSVEKHSDDDEDEDLKNATEALQRAEERAVSAEMDEDEEAEEDGEEEMRRIEAEMAEEEEEELEHPVLEKEEEIIKESPRPSSSEEGEVEMPEIVKEEFPKAEEPKVEEEEEGDSGLVKISSESKNLEIRRLSATDEADKIIQDAWTSPDKDKEKELGKTPLQMVENIISNMPQAEEAENSSSEASSPQPPSAGHSADEVQQQQQPQAQQASVMMVNTLNGPMLMQAMPLAATATAAAGPSSSSSTPAANLFKERPILKKKSKKKKTISPSESVVASTTPQQQTQPQQQQQQQQPQQQQLPQAARSTTMPILVPVSSTAGPQLVAINQGAPAGGIVATAGPTGPAPLLLNQAGHVSILPSGTQLVSVPTVPAVQPAATGVVLNPLPDGTFYQTTMIPAATPILINQGPTQATAAPGAPAGTFIMTQQGLVQTTPHHATAAAAAAAGTPGTAPQSAASQVSPSTSSVTSGPMMVSPGGSDAGAGMAKKVKLKKKVKKLKLRKKKVKKKKKKPTLFIEEEAESAPEEDTTDDDDDSDEDRDLEDADMDDEDGLRLLARKEARSRPRTSTPMKRNKASGSCSANHPKSSSSGTSTGSRSGSASPAKRGSPGTSGKKSKTTTPEKLSFLQSNQVDSSGLKATPPHPHGGDPGDVSTSDLLDTSGASLAEDDKERRKKKKKKRSADELIKEALMQTDDDSDDSPDRDADSDSNVRQFSVGDVVWGPHANFPSWPGKLNQIRKDSDMVEVCWFGSKEVTVINAFELKSLSDGLEAHHRERKRIRKGRKMNSSLEKAIQEAMLELDRMSADTSVD